MASFGSLHGENFGWKTTSPPLVFGEKNKENFKWDIGSEAVYIWDGLLFINSDTIKLAPQV